MTTKPTNTATGEARISAIQSCEEAAGREALASHLALKTNLPIESAKGVLAAAPAEAAHLGIIRAQELATGADLHAGNPALKH